MVPRNSTETVLTPEPGIRPFRTAVPFWDTRLGISLEFRFNRTAVLIEGFKA